MNREVARDLLRLFGLDSTLAENGREALEAWARSEYDLILMDCQMPAVDGYQATRAIRDAESRGEAPRPRTTIVAMTAHAMEGDRSECLAAGMDDYLAKPFKLGGLERMLQKWLPAASAQGRGGAGPQEADGRGPIESEAFEDLRAMEEQGASGVVRRTVDVYLEEGPRVLES